MASLFHSSHRRRILLVAIFLLSLAFLLVPESVRQLIFAPFVHAEVTIDDTLNTTVYQFNASPAVVFTSATTGYAIYVDGTSNDLVYSKTTDGGKTWGSAQAIETTKTWVNVAVWYDQWTPGDTTGTKIYIHAVETATSDSFFTYLDTNGDSLRGGGIVTVLQSISFAGGTSGPPSITKSVDGYLFASCNFNSVPTGGLISKSTDGGDNWSSAKPNDWSGQSADQIQLVPLKEGGDILAIKASSGATDLIRSRVYDEGTDTWDSTWTTIGTLVDNTTYDQWYSAMVKKSTGDIYLSFANNTNGGGNDLAFWKYSDASRTWSQKTDILTNDATAIAPAIMIDDDMDDLYVAYIQGTLGSSTYVYYKRSSDDGASWSVPKQLSLTQYDFKSIRTNAMSSDILFPQWYNTGYNRLLGSVLPFELHPGTQATIDDSLTDASDEAAASPSVVFTSRDTGYAFYIDHLTNLDLAYRKTTDGGTSWGSPVVIETSKSWTTLAVWYDRWTPGNRTGTGINIVAIEDSTDDNWFFSMDATDDVVSAPIATNFSTNFSEGPNGAAPSVVRGSGGALFTAANFTTPIGGTVAKSTNEGVSWSDVTPSSWSSDNQDAIQLLPLKTGQDILAIKMDTVSDVIQSRIYTEATDTWAGSWSTIDNLTDSTTYLQWFSAAVRSGSGDVFLAFQNASAATGNDLKFYHFSDATRTWTARTDIVSDSSQILGASTFVDEMTGMVYVAYIRGDPHKAISSAHIVYKYSTDNGVTWSAEQAPLSTAQGNFRIVRGNMNSDGRLYAVWYHDTNDDLFGSTIALPGARYTQAAYRFYQNANSLDVGSVLANQDAPATLTSINQAFRLRLSLRDTDRELKKSHEELKLQYAPKSGSCSASTFQNITSLSPITWNDNASAKDGAVFTSNANDPTYDGTERNQTYVESNAFTNSGSTISSGENGVWDFSLKDNGGYGTTYCFRIAKRDGTTFGTYSVYPEITTAGYPTISGKVYTDEGTTAMSTGRRVSISSNGGPATGSGLTRAGGFYTATLTGATLTGGTILSLYLDGATEKAVTVTLGSGSSMTGINLYQNHLITRSDSGSVALTSAHLNVANNNGDSDITALYNTDASNNLQVAADKELYVWPGDTFSPGARVRTHDLEVLGTLSLSTNGLTVSGSLIASAGTLTTSTGITILNASSETLTLGSNALRNLTLQASSVTLGSALDVNGTLTIGTSSSLDVSATPYNITLSGSLINKAGTTGFTKRTGTVTLDGGDQTLSGSTIFHNLTKTVTTAKTLTMYKGYVTSVSGALTLRGTTNNLLSLRSSTNGSAARMILDGDSGTQLIDYMNVKDNDASGGLTLECLTASEGCVNAGNTTNWFFGSTLRKHFFFFLE